MDKRELLSLKVQRVVSQKANTAAFLSQQEIETYLTLEDDFDCDKLPEHLSSEWRFLPKNYGQIYLGETFSFYTRCTNDSVTELVKDVSLRVDLQLTSNRVIFLGEHKIDTLDSKGTLHELMHHEVKEMGTNVLICTVNYKDSADEVHSFRKFFRFHVDKPLDVKTKFYNAESDEVYLEALLQNLTNNPISLDQVSLEPSAYFDVKAMNKITLESGEEQWVFGPINRFNPNEFRQYLFCLTPKDHVKRDVKLLKSVTVIGKLDIIWTSGIGCRGHLQTSQLERMAPSYSDLRLTVEEIPGEVPLRTDFTITCKLTNCCDYEMEPHIHFDNLDTEQSIKWVGTSGQGLGKLMPLTSTEFTLTGHPVKPGLLPIPSLKISDPILKNDFKFDDIAYIFVRE